MTDDDYFAGPARPAPRTVVEQVNENLAKHPRRRDRSVESEVRALRWLGNIADCLLWWVWW
jgi:hypothetical protein